MMKSINKLILEPYKGSGKIEATGASSGFATVKQKTNLVGLKLIVDACIIRNGIIEFQAPKGTKVYFTEEVLHATPWAKKVFECDVIKEKFILGEHTQVVFINETKKAK